MIHYIGTRLRIGKARRDAPLANKVKRVTALNVWNSSTCTKNRMRRCAGSAPRSMAIIAGARLGATPEDCYLICVWAFWLKKRKIRTAIERILSWQPDHVILGHERCFDMNGSREIRRAFRWALNS